MRQRRSVAASGPVRPRGRRGMVLRREVIGMAAACEASVACLIYVAAVPLPSDQADRGLAVDWLCVGRLTLVSDLDVRTYAWNWFALHANQRLQLVNFWLVAVAFLAGAF